MAGGAPTVASAAALLMTVIDDVDDDLAIGLGFMVDDEPGGEGMELLQGTESRRRS